MKPPRIDYRAPRSLDEALAVLTEDPDDTSLLAGGQSLMPLLNLRMARPAIVVDLNGIDELAAIDRSNGWLRIGAMVRQRRLETDAALTNAVPLLDEAAHHIAHVAVRTRGTVGGSMAHADPSAELPATMAALGARVELRRAGATPRMVAAEDFVLGPLMTAAEPGELVTAIEVPLPEADTGWCFMEVARTHGAFALAGAACLVRLDAAGRMATARLALCGVGGQPYVARWIEQLLAGAVPEDELFAAAGARVSAEVEPFGDGHAGSDYRRRAAGVLARRALATAARRAGSASEMGGA